MARLLYIDCFSGISGDKTLGAFVDLGYPVEELRRELARLPLSGYAIDARTVERSYMRGTHVTVDVATGDAAGGHRGKREIDAIVEGSSLSAAVKARARAMFDRILVEEARIHNISVDEVHLHEVGAVDALVDIVGTAIAVEALAPDRIVCSPVNVGSGAVDAAHGHLPVPAPAAAEILKGVPIYAKGPAFELTTPTGATIARTLAGSFGALPAMTVERIGYGAGTKDWEGFPNLLRLLWGSEATAAEGHPHAAGACGELELETNVDDCPPAVLAHAMERMFAAGAVEVFFVPIQMKKSRPGIMLRAILPASRLHAVARVVFEETTSIGLRYHATERITLARRFEQVETPWGTVPVKVSFLDRDEMQATPEIDEARKLALQSGVPLARVLEEAIAAYRRRSGPGGAPPGGKEGA